eukprot:EG_transcript_42844
MELDLPSSPAPPLAAEEAPDATTDPAEAAPEADAAPEREGDGPDGAVETPAAFQPFNWDHYAQYYTAAEAPEAAESQVANPKKTIIKFVKKPKAAAAAPTAAPEPAAKAREPEARKLPPAPEYADLPPPRDPPLRVAKPPWMLGKG